MYRHLCLLIAGLFLATLWLPLLAVQPAKAQSTGDTPRIGQNLCTPGTSDDGMYIDLYEYGGFSGNTGQQIGGPYTYPIVGTPPAPNLWSAWEDGPGLSGYI